MIYDKPIYRELTPYSESLQCASLVLNNYTDLSFLITDEIPRVVTSGRNHTSCWLNTHNLYQNNSRIIVSI